VVPVPSSPGMLTTVATSLEKGGGIEERHAVALGLDGSGIPPLEVKDRKPICRPRARGCGETLPCLSVVPLA